MGRSDGLRTLQRADDLRRPGGWPVRLLPGGAWPLRHLVGSDRAPARRPARRLPTGALSRRGPHLPLPVPGHAHGPGRPIRLAARGRPLGAPARDGGHLRHHCPGLRRRRPLHRGQHRRSQQSHLVGPLLGPIAQRQGRDPGLLPAALRAGRCRRGDGNGPGRGGGPGRAPARATGRGRGPPPARPVRGHRTRSAQQLALAQPAHRRAHARLPAASAGARPAPGGAVALSGGGLAQLARPDRRAARYHRLPRGPVRTHARSPGRDRSHPR